jgi:hypothetical protein
MAGGGRRRTFTVALGTVRGTVAARLTRSARAAVAAFTRTAVDEPRLATQQTRACAPFAATLAFSVVRYHAAPDSEASWAKRSSANQAHVVRPAARRRLRRWNYLVETP